MKKMILFFILVLAGILLISFFYNNYNEKEQEQEIKEDYSKEEKGVFISYIDYSHLKGRTKEEIEDLITEMINNISYYGLNTIILQVSPFSDAIYPSKIYQSSHTVVQKEGDELPLDILKCFIEKASEKNISIYAWLNPYRIRNDNNTGDISKDSYYYEWFDTDNIQITDKGVFLNPASSDVLEYITKGLKELCQNYDIKGVLYDDYFYPNDTIDLKTYEKTDKSVNLKEYRINNINKLIEQSYDTIKSVNKDIKFGLSPAGNIENNLDKEYLDVKSILNGNKIDFIIPQLYYGFSNSTKPYLSTLEQWSSLNIKNKDFYVALSLYKSGKVDKYAGKGENEWLEENDIIKKQIITARNKNNYKGFYIFRYEYLFEIHNNESLNKEVENLKALIDKS